MNRDEFNQWARDFASKFPDTGKWFFALPTETHDSWFEIFKPYKLDDAKSFNTKLMYDGLPNRWEREQLPRLFIKGLAEISFSRQERFEKAEKRKREKNKTHKSRSGFETIDGDPIMAKMFDHVIAKTKAFVREHSDECERITFVYKDEEYHHDYVPPKLIPQWTEEACERFDTEPESDDALERFRCFRCKDTGIVARDDETNTAGHCVECKLGEHRASTPYRSGRKIGPSQPQRVQAFDDWNNR